MRQLQNWVVGLAVFGLLAWIAWTSPTLKECVQAANQSYSQQPLPENISAFYGLSVGYRLCLGAFLRENGESIIALFTVILGIATWFLWRATRDLVKEAKISGTAQLAITKTAADAATKSANAATAATRAYVCFANARYEPIRNVETGEFVVRVYVDFINIGTTPALECGVYREPVVIVPFGTDFDLPAERPTRTENDLKSIVHLAAGKTVATNPVYITREDIERAERQEIEVYVLAGTEYRNVMDPDNERITDVCVKMRIICPVFDQNDPRPANERIVGVLHRSRMT